MQGMRDIKNTLYMINMHLPTVPTAPTAPDNQVAKHMYETKPKKDLILFYHGACFSPPKITFIKAIKQNAFTYCPGLTAELAQKYLYQNGRYS